jgi:hypothetical protein
MIFMVYTVSVVSVEFLLEALDADERRSLEALFGKLQSRATQLIRQG